MSFIFSRALAEESLQVNCGEIDAYAPLNLIPTPKRSSSHGRTTEHFRLSRFGMTFEPLTDADCEELLTLWLAGFPARTSARPATETDSTASAAASGSKWRGSFAKFDPVESKWKTAQCSLLGDSEEFSETWPRWGSMSNGECFLRPIPALPICANESGFWQTPVADDAVERKAGKWNSRGEPKLSAEVKLWPMPQAHDAQKGYAERVGRFGTKHGGRNLNDEVLMYPTPCAIDSGTGRVNKSPSPGAAERPTLAMMARKNLWPTPCASASKGSSPAALTRKNGRDRSNDRIDHAVMASDGGQLNPEWVEWLMGWPIGHTALKPLETARYREWMQQHSPY